MCWQMFYTTVVPGNVCAATIFTSDKSIMLQDTLLFAAPGNLPVALIAALFGLIVGSFLNVVIHRVPK